LPAGPRSFPASVLTLDRLPSMPRTAKPQGGPLTAFGRRAAPRDGGMTAFGPRLSRPLALRAAASSRASEGPRRLSIARAAPLPLAIGGSTANPTAGSDRRLDCDRAAASFREGRPPACPQPRSGAKLLPGLAPTPPGRGRSRGRKRDRGMPRHIERHVSLLSGIAARVLVSLLSV
jgi:hypothetical protein